MAVFEHRVTQCFKLRTPLSFNRMEDLPSREHQANGISSSTGVAQALPPGNSKRKSRNKNQGNEAL
jgi:hypothetical protein